MATHSEFARFEDRVDETIEKQITRLETRLDPLANVVADLAVLKDRQSSAAAHVADAKASVAAMGERFENRAVAMGERFDGRVSDLVKAHAELERKVDSYVQRYVGGSIALGAVWAVASHFLNR